MSEPGDPRLEALEARVRTLEAEVAQLRAAAPAARVASFRAGALAPPPPPPPTGPPTGFGAPPPPPTGAPFSWGGAPTMPATRPRRAPSVDSETVLKWGGVGLVVLAVGFAVSTAISRGWIGPELQLAGAVVLSLALIATGLRLRSTRRPWTHALCSGGVAALFVTVASNLFLDQVDTDVARGATIIIALGGYALARYVRSEWIAGVALVGGIIGWLVIADGSPALRPTVGWYALHVALALALSISSRWAVLRIAAQVAGLFTVAGFVADAEGALDRVLVLGLGAAVAAALLTVPSIRTDRPAWRALEMPLATLLGPWALMAITVTFDIDDARPSGFVAFGVAATVAGVATVVRRRLDPTHLIALLLGASVTCSIGVSLVLDADATALALAVQGAGLLVLARRLDRRVLLLVDGSILCGGTALFVLGRSLDAWANDAPLGQDLAHLATLLAALAGAWTYRDRTVRRLASAGFLGVLLVWVGSVLVHLPQGQALVSAVWAAIGIVVLLVGATRKLPDLGAAGLTVLGATVVKLLTVDLREVDALWRAGLFFLVGFALLRLGFLLPRLTARGHDAQGT